jgi:hypothetical protein
MPQKQSHECQNHNPHYPTNTRSKKTPLELALLSGTGAGFIPVAILTLDSGIFLRVGGRGVLALRSGFGNLPGTGCGLVCLVGLVLGRSLLAGSLLAGFQSVDVLSHSSSAVAYILLVESM